MSAARPMGIEEVLTALRKGWPVVLGCALIAWAIAYSRAGHEAPLYQSETRLVIAPAEIKETRDLIDTSAGLERESIINTLAEVMMGSKMRDAASADARLDGVDLTQYSAKSTAAPLANVVTLFVRGPDAVDARRVATVLVQRGTQYFESVYRIYRVDELDAPSLPAGPVAPTPARDGALAGFGGAMLGIAVVMGVWGWRRQSEAVPADESPFMVDGLVDPLPRVESDDLAAVQVPRLVEVPRVESAGDRRRGDRRGRRDEADEPDVPSKPPAPRRAPRPRKQPPRASAAAGDG